MISRKIWSLPLVLVTALLLVGLFAASVLAQANRASVPANMSVVAEANTDAVVVYKVSNYTAPADDASTGASGILAVNTQTTTQIGADGVAVAAETDRAAFEAVFALKAEEQQGVTDATRFDRITVTPVAGLAAGTTYTVRVAAAYDTNIATDVPDRAPGDVEDAITWTGDGITDNDQDGELVTILTIHVPIVATPLQFQVEAGKVVKGELISRVGRDRDSNPNAFEIKNLGRGTATVERDTGVTAVNFEVSGGNKVLVRADVNNVAATAYAGTISIDRGDHDLNGVDTDNAIDIEISANVVAATALAFTDGTDAIAVTEDDPYHYEVTIPETTTMATGVLAYYVSGASDAINGNGDADEPEVPVERITGVIGGASASLFRVNNETMAIEYAGAENGLTAGVDHILRITASGDRGLANRLIVGMVKISVADVDSAPTGVPETLPVALAENEAEAGLVEDDTVVHDFAGVGTDPEGRPLTYSTSASGFDFDGTKLMVNGAILDIARAGDNPATEDVTETTWPSAAPTDWQFTTSPPTSEYPDLTRTISVIASDGVPSNNKTISVTITLSLNAPVAAKTDNLPTNVMTGMIDEDDDAETAAVAGYTLVASVAERELVVTLVNLGDLVNDADSDDLDFDVSSGASHVVYDSTNDSLLLTYLPPEADPGPRVDVITVTADDGFNSAEDDAGDAIPDVTLYMEISVTELPPEPVTSDFVGITVEEGSLDCELTDGGGACSVAGVIATGVSYSIESGVDSPGPGTEVTDYVVDADGLITVTRMLDFETGGAPAFLVNVWNVDRDLAGIVSVRVTITDVDEDPTITAVVMGTAVPWVYETAQIGDDVLLKPDGQVGPDAENDDPIVVVATDPEGEDITYSIQQASEQAFAIDASTGELTVSGALDHEAKVEHPLTIVAADPGGNTATLEITVHVLGSNESPEFTSPTGDAAVVPIDENRVSTDDAILTFTAADADGDDLTFTLRQGQSQDLFVIMNARSEMVEGVEVWSGDLHAKGTSAAEGTDAGLNFEYAGYDPRVHVEVNDPEGLNDTLLVTVNLNNLNDNMPIFDADPAATSLQVAENTARDYVLANYSATDDDGDTVFYDLGGDDEKSFSISDTGDLMTLESLDADNAMTPCGSDGCAVTVIAMDREDGLGMQNSVDVRITVMGVEDSVSTLDVSKANPVPGTTMGRPMSALSNTKTTKSSAVPERPAGLPAIYGDAPMNFVATEWGNWGTVLRIAVTSESPHKDCGNGNQCVIVNINSDSADDSLKLAAYRSAGKENQFVAAVMLVEQTDDATPGDDAVYRHGASGGVPAIRVDEEDEIEVEFGNLRDSIEVENEAPEISNFAPEHDTAFDDADVDYTFTVTDVNSGLPEPEDLPDADGDDNYTPVVALISKGQCETHADTDTVDAKALKVAASIHEDETLYCPGEPQTGEFIATGTGFGFAPIRDDKDFDEIDDGFDVETTIVLDENRVFYVTFIVCDNAGNCTFYDPDGNDDDEELAQITVDTEDPEFVEARTGLTWDSTDNEYDDNRSYIQVIFDDLTSLNVATVEVDDFVVEGHSVKDVHVFENPDDDDVTWGDSGRYVEKAPTGSNGKKNLYQDIENSVFIELEDELLADETPDVTIVPNGVEDDAGNEQDDGDHEADDWISPSFTIVSITSTLETSQDEVLAGDGDEVTVVVTADERLDQTRPTVTVTYVIAPPGSVDTKGVATCDDKGDNDGTRERGEIVSNDNCADSGAATGGNLNNSVEKVSNTEWIVTITEPKDTGYYNFRISGKDRSPQENPGSEGVSPGSIVTDFFDADGDVNVDDAIFFEGDINLPKPNVRVSGVSVQDNEADVEFRSPLFVELDFAANHAVCGRNADDDERMANCTNENSEYAEDNFDDIVVTSFVLDGVDLTDSVKTTDSQSFLVSLESISIGDHTAEVQAVDQAGNVFEDTLEIDFEVNDRDPFEKRLSPGWNLVSLPGEPADSSIASVFGPGVEVRTVYSYDPVIPGGWMVAVRETLDSDWQGDLTEITGQRGYWVLSDAIQDWEVSIPRLAGGASGTGTPIQPPVIPMYAGWNLIPVTDVSGNALGTSRSVSAEVYLNSLDDGLDLARVLGYDTIRNEWFTVLDAQMGSPGNLSIGSGYWVFVRAAAALVPGGVASTGGGD